jgi:hypothetical protein
MICTGQLQQSAESPGCNAADFISFGVPEKSGFALFLALGFVNAGGAACTSSRALTAPMGQSETHEKHDQK